ncbi:MAG: NUDIX domain-containing protein [Simkaniaceae bacterium]
MKQEKVFGVLPLRSVDNKWQILILYHKNGLFWGFPKGHPVDGEPPKKTAERELFEETNLEITEFFKGDPFHGSYTFRREGLLIEKEVVFFPAKVEGKLSLQKKEIIEAKWCFFDEALHTLTFPEAKKVCREINNRLTLETNILEDET